jgi:hypothetical protein
MSFFVVAAPLAADAIRHSALHNPNSAITPYAFWYLETGLLIIGTDGIVTIYLCNAVVLVSE